uniref:PICALM interacting mitotic regulator n=1 Tax=Chlorocebus sabaeus TaxID=60711 RepID=A0A0D9RXH3_CHLSB
GFSWQDARASMRWRSLQHQEQLLDGKELQPMASHQEISARALGSLCRQFQRKLSLRAVNLNLRAGTSWKPLETRVRAARDSRLQLAQRIQKSCQSSTKWLVETQVKARRRKKRGNGSPTCSLRQKSIRLSRAAPDHSATEPPHHHLSTWTGSRAHPLRQWKQEGAFQSPCSSTELLCSPSEYDSDLEAGAGIRHLRKLSQELDEAIMAEERKQALSDHQSFIPKNVCASP